MARSCDVCGKKLEWPLVEAFDYIDPELNKQVNHELCPEHKRELDSYYASDVIPAVSRIWKAKIADMTKREAEDKHPTPAAPAPEAETPAAAVEPTREGNR